MEVASKARRTSCIRAMVKPEKHSVTKLHDTHICIVFCCDVIYDPEILLYSHVPDVLLGTSAVLCYRYPSIATGCRYLLMAYEREKRAALRDKTVFFLLSDTESVMNLCLCPVSKFDIFIQSGSPIIPHIKSADSDKVEFGQFSPVKSSPLPS